MPPVLLALVNMVLHGPNIKNQIDSLSTQAAFSIAKLLKFNSVYHWQKQKKITSLVQRYNIPCFWDKADIRFHPCS